MILGNIKINQASGIVFDELLLYYMLYADDLVLCSDSVAGLHKQLDGLHECCKWWHLLVNMIKTKVLILSKKQTNCKFYYNNIEVDVSIHYKHLGVWLNVTYVLQ